MPNTTKDGSSMVGMEQCRISSIESNTSSSPLLEGGKNIPSSVPAAGGGAAKNARLYSQKSRGSHSSSGGSCEGGPEDSIILSDCGTEATEAQPLLPVSTEPEPEEWEEIQKGTGITAQVNKLHFELFDQPQQKEENVPCLAPPEASQIETAGVISSKDMMETMTESNPMYHPKNVRMKNGSNDTVCTSSSSTSSSSTTTATATIASSHSNKSSRSATGNNKLGRGNNNNRNKRLRHLSTDTDDTSDISATLEAPDGGWGWVVVAASFLVNLIADGVTFSFGVFFIEFQQFFNESESTTAWIGSLLAAMPLLSGPVASWLTDRYGCRNVTIVGGLLASLGFALSSMATSIFMLSLTFGCLAGFGLSLCYVAAVVIVAYYFERKRSFATGISVCGGGIGTFLFAPICQNLIKWYGWQRTTLILAGVFLILAACGLPMKDLEWTKKKNKGSNNNSNGHHHHNNLSNHDCTANQNFLQSNPKYQYQMNSQKSYLTCPSNKRNNRRCNSAICIPTFVQEQERRERRQRYYSCNQDPDGSVPANVNDRSRSPSRHGSGKQYSGNKAKTLCVKSMDDDALLLSPPPHADLTEEFILPDKKDSGRLVKIINPIPLENEMRGSIIHNESNNSSITNLNNLNSNLVRNNSFLGSNINNNNINSTTTTTIPVVSTTIMPTSGGAVTTSTIPTIIIPPAQQTKQSVNSNNFSGSNNNNNNSGKLDIINSARYRSVMHRHSLTYRGAVLNLKRYRLRPARSCPDIISVATSGDGRGSFELMHIVGDVRRWIHAVCEWDNLVNTRFLLFILSNLLLYTWYDVPYMYLQSAAVRKGYPDDLSSYLISSIGLSNVVGNILLGYLGDKEWASATCVYGVCMIICGGTTVLMPYLMEWNYWALFVVCGVFGLTIAANYALTSVILVQVVSLERFASAYGLLLLVQGIGNLVGPPIAGVISDLTDTNTYSFVVAGVGIFASSFFVLAPVFQRELRSDPTSGDHHHPHAQQPEPPTLVGDVGHKETV